MSVSLNCIAGPLKGQTFSLSGGPVFLFGRYAKAHFSLSADAAASNLHFLVDLSENRVRITDLGSTNGLIINDKHYGGKLGSPLNGFITLKSGDTILAGACLFRVTIEDDAAPSGADEPRGNIVMANSKRHAVKGAKLTAIISKGEEKPAVENMAESAAPKASQPQEAEEPGTVEFSGGVLPEVEGYTIIERIGGGGKGVVFRAIKNDSGAAAAIKMMLFNRNKSKKQRSLEMFRREIQITRQLKHPHIIRYLGDGISQGLPFLALEYVDGGTIDELIHHAPEKRLNLPQVVPLFIQLLEAVAYMHGQSLVHRDIKPKNVLLDLRRGGSLAVKLSDMGLSCRFSNSETDDFLPIVSEGGTPAYMPPEQLTDLTRAIPQSDVFSAAATFYQMVTGSLLYDFSDKEQNEAILEGNIKPILQLRPDMPLAIGNVITRALSYRPEDRYANAQEMLGAFKKALS